jgi:hypothetical protein
MPNFFAIFDVSFVTVVGLLGILRLRTEGPESFSPSDVCSKSSSAIASSSSSSEDGSHLLPISSSVSEFEPKTERLCQCQSMVSEFPAKNTEL